MRDLRAAPGRNDLCHCGSGKKYKKCHWEQDQASPRPAADLAPVRERVVAAGRPLFRRNNPNLIKTPEQVEGIRKAGHLTWQLLEMLEGRIKPGITTNQIDRWVEDATQAAGATSAPLGYTGSGPTPYPKSVCTSINNVVCHGIPGEVVLQEGDIINVDISPILNGYFGDSSRTYKVGKVSADAEKLVRVTKECLELGIRQVRPGGFVGDIGQAIQAHAESHGFSVVRDFVGHGVGIKFHEEPQIPHFGRRGTGHPLLPGMVFTIEPMINAGAYPTVILDDGWTAITRDGSLSAQFEHTIHVTETGHEVLTLPA
ncbi:MAG TPA: type I methionyl aminopeptidase [bacterium]